MPTSLTDQMFQSEESKSLTDQMFSQPSLTDQMYAEPGSQPLYSFEPSDRAQPYLDQIAQAEKQYGLPENLLANVIKTESQFDPSAKSPAGAVGIAQIMPKYHPDIDPTDPRASIDYSAEYLSKLYKRFGDWDKAIMAYNAGPTAIARGRVPKETSSYLEKINASKYVKPDLSDEVVDEPEFGPAEVSEGEPSIFSMGMDTALGKSVKEYDETRINPILTEKFKADFVDTLSGYAELAKNPMEIVRGGAEFVLSLPGFGIGILTAGQKMLERMGRPFDFEELYDAASDGMSEAMEWWQKGGVEPLLGKPSAETQLVGSTAMAPALALSEVGKAVSESESLKDYPNLRGLARFAGDIGGLVALGRLYKGANREVTAKAESITRRAKQVIDREELLKQTVDERIRLVQQKILDMEKNQLEMEAAEIQANLDYGKMIKEDLSSKRKTIDKIKSQPQKALVDVQIDKALKGKDRLKIKRSEPKAEVEPVPTHGTTLDRLDGILSKGLDRGSALDLTKDRSWVGEYEVQVEVPTARRGKYIAHNDYYESANRAKPTKVIVDIEAFTDQGADVALRQVNELKKKYPKVKWEIKGKGPGPDAITVSNVAKLYERIYDLPLGEALETAKLDFETDVMRMYRMDTKKTVRTLDEYEEMLKYWEDKAPKEPITDLDLQTGTREPVELSTHKSPFRQEPKVTEFRDKLFESRKSISPSVEELINQDPNMPARDINVTTAKLLNDMNRYLDGKDVDVAATRDYLSELAARADELRMLFEDSAEHLDWKETISEAAKWARRAERAEVPTVDLNMMIPLDSIPVAVVDTIKKFKDLFPGRVKRGKYGYDIKVGSLYRNEPLFDHTGFWLGRDGKWRYEIDDTKAKYNVPQAVRTLNIAGKTAQRPITDILDYPELYKAIPEAKNLKVIFDPKLEPAGQQSGSFIFLQRFGDKTSFFHELQHAINTRMNAFMGTSVKAEQKKLVRQYVEEMYDLARDQYVRRSLGELLMEMDEGTADVGNTIRSIRDVAETSSPADAKMIAEYIAIPKSEARKVYKTTPGEMEARLAEHRMNMSSEARKLVPPWESLDEMLYGEGLADSVGNLTDVTAGTKLYSGIPLDQAAKDIVAGARKVAEYTKYARGMKAFKPKVAAKMIRDEFNRSFIDRSGNIRKDLLDKLSSEGYEVIQRMYLAKGSSSIAARMLKQMGKEVYGGLTQTEKRVLDNLILASRMVDIGRYKTPKQFKFPKEIEPKNSIAYLELFPEIEKLSPEQASTLSRRVDAYFEWMKKPLQDMLSEGLISEQEFADLSSHNYRRLKLVDVYDKKYQAKVGKKKRTVYDSGVESLARGRDTDVFEPSSQVMALEVFNRAYGRVMNNKANRALLELARKDETNPFVRIKEKKGDKIPSGWNRFFVYEEGQRKTIYLSPEMSKEWIVSNPEMSYRLSQMVRWLSGSAVLRTFATGINWGFALANLPRDVMHTWFAARTFENGKWKPLYNANMPVFGIQMTHDLTSVFSDAVLRRGRYENYINEGGGMEFMVHQGRLLQRGRHIEGPIDKLYDFFGYFGETSEIMTRLAIRERALRKGKSPQEATFAARDYMDFGQGGGIGKAADNGIPYLNAAIQGTRGLLRSFKDNPVRSTYKLAQLGALTTGIYIAMQKMHPQTAKNLKGNIDMQNNLCIPLGDQFGFEDEHGNMRYPYIKIPLDPGQKFFKTFFEAAADKWLGNEVDVDRVVDSLKEQSPVGVTELPPSISGLLGYVTNKDFWLNEDIWRKTDKPFSWPESREEYTKNTPEFYKDVGKLTGLSPERTKYMVEELVTNGTVWSYLLGQGYDAAFSDLPKSKKEQHLAQVISKIPVIKRFFGVTNPYSKHAKKFSEVEQESVLKNFVENRGFDTLVEGYLYDKNVSKKEVFSYLKSFKDIDTQDRLFDRYEFEIAIKNLPEKSFWRRMKGLLPEARAKMFYDRLEISSEDERKQLWKEFNIISTAGGVISDKFLDEYEKLKK